jgi:hypothetical protein
MVDLAAVAAWLTLVAGVPVSCPAAIPFYDVGFAAGVYRTADHRVELDDFYCAHLDLLRTRRFSRSPVVQRRVAVSLLILGHELAHAHGIRGERAADRAACRSLPALAARMGVGRGYVAVLRSFLPGVARCR